MSGFAVCCLLLAVYVSKCMEVPVCVERVDHRKDAPHRQVCPQCDTVVSRGYVKDIGALRMVLLTTERDKSCG